MIRAGITGGIGSGKSEVCRYFEHRQVPVYYADLEANKLIDSDASIRTLITRRFGEPSYSNGKLNRPFIREMVFNNKEALADLNSITHPVVLRHFDNWCLERKKEKHVFVIKEAALVFESDSYKSLDFVVCVVAPLEDRIRRVMQRDGKSREEIMDIIGKQWSDEEKISRSSYVINNPDAELLLPKITELHKLLINKS